MENQNQDRNREEMPQAQSMSAMNKKDLIYLFLGLGLNVLGNVTDGPAFLILGIVFDCIYLYKFYKYKKATTRKRSSQEGNK